MLGFVVPIRDDQMEAISQQLPADKAELKKFFPKSWCDRYGDVVLDVVKKEFKDHVGEMENMRNASREKHSNNSKRWTTFEDDNDDHENFHPNLFAYSNSNMCLENNNPFFHDYSSESNGNKLRSESSSSFQDQNRPLVSKAWPYFAWLENQDAIAIAILQESTFSHLGLVDKGKHWFHFMVNESEIQLDDAYMIDLLSWATKKILESNLDDLGIYVLVSNFFSMANKWDEATI
ncbi:hypothetical protein GH714_011849 [Hevea brasiliensis]|uniref:Uncharacterized protein n=1 Tax=Hevea brasiliensis TaxID=3981 RepID=A0A6A6MTA9_HEVBR|nr:hypothetical protein GH714_011849 [Hevea brasiliensis]